MQSSSRPTAAEVKTARLSCQSVCDEIRDTESRPAGPARELMLRVLRRELVLRELVLHTLQNGVTP